MIQRCLCLGVCVAAGVVSCQPGVDCGADLIEGTAEATVAGANWVGDDATFIWAGSSVQINIPSNEGWMFTLTGRKTTVGMSVRDAVDAEDFPVVMDLSGDGGFAIAYPTEGGSSFSTTLNGSGSLEVTEVGSGLRACFSFIGVSDSGQDLEVNAGQVYAAASR